MCGALGPASALMQKIILSAPRERERERRESKPSEVTVLKEG